MQQLRYISGSWRKFKFSTVRTGIGKWCFDIARNVSVGELEHESINFLSLTGQTERLQEKAKSVNKRHVRKVKLVDKCMHDGDIEILSNLESACFQFFSSPTTHPSPKYSPITALLRPSVCKRNAAISAGWELAIKPASMSN
jgi:hypothetical protein